MRTIICNGFIFEIEDEVYITVPQHLRTLYPYDKTPLSSLTYDETIIIMKEINMTASTKKSKLKRMHQNVKSFLLKFSH